MKKISVLLLTVLFVLNSVRPVHAADDAIIRYVMETMSLEEKIGQLFIVRPDCLDPNISMMTAILTIRYLRNLPGV